MNITKWTEIIEGSVSIDNDANDYFYEFLSGGTNNESWTDLFRRVFGDVYDGVDVIIKIGEGMMFIKKKP